MWGKSQICECGGMKRWRCQQVNCRRYRSFAGMAYRYPIDFQMSSATVYRCSPVRLMKLNPSAWYRLNVFDRLSCFPIHSASESLGESDESPKSIEFPLLGSICVCDLCNIWDWLTDKDYREMFINHHSSPSPAAEDNSPAQSSCLVVQIRWTAFRLSCQCGQHAAAFRRTAHEVNDQD